MTEVIDSGFSDPAGPRNGATRSERRGLLLRVGITVALIAVVMWRLDWETLAAKFAAFDPAWTTLAFVTVFAAVALSAWKWGLILRWRGHALPYVRLLRHYFVGLFFNNVLPTTVGGDAVRAWETTRDTREVPEAIGSVVTERLIAGAALGFTALLGLPFVETSPRLLLLVSIFLIIDLALVALFLLPRVAEAIVAGLLPPRLSGLREAVAGTVGVVRASLRTPRLFVKVALLSIAFQILVAAVNACIFNAMGVSVSLAQCVILTPMIFTVTMLPISLSGLGVREAAYWYFFSQVGVGQVDAVVASLAFFVIVGISSLPGAPLFVWNRRRSGTAVVEFLAAGVNFPREIWKRAVNLCRGVKDISPGVAHVHIQSGDSLVLDVRDQTEYDAGHLPGSMLMPLRTLGDRIDELAPYRNRPIVIICHGGARSATACWQLGKKGFAQTYNVAGGILAWKKANLPIEMVKSTEVSIAAL